MNDSIKKLETMPIPKLVLIISAPVILSMIIQALYNIVDSAFIANYSEQAFTSVSLAFPIQLALSAIAAGTGIGITSMISRKLGEKDIDGASNSAEHGILLFIVYSIVFVILGLFTAKYFFRMFTNDTALIAYGTTYISIIMIFTFGRMISQGFMSIFQGSGSMVIPMISQILGAVINVILDPILIFGTVFDIRFCEPMGIKGAAIATVIGQICAMLFLVIRFFSKTHVVSLRLKQFKFNLKILGGILAVGVPVAISQGTMSIMVIGFNMILATKSIAAVTALGAYFKLNSFVFMPIYGLSAGVIPIAGYSFGAKNKARFKKTVKVGSLYAVAVAIIGLLLFMLIPGKLLSIFNLSQEVIIMGSRAFRILGIMFPIIGVCIILASSMQAIGKATVSMVSDFIRGIIFLLPLAYLFTFLFGVDYSWFASPIAEIASITYLIYSYCKVLKDWN
jgi:putative MATE family efflux protein